MSEEPPKLIFPSVAKAIGMNECIVMQQVLFYVASNARKGREELHFRNGRWWCWNTVEDWEREFPWWSKNTIKRTFKKLRDMGLVLAEKHGRNAFEHTLWYSVDLDALDELMGADFPQELRLSHNEPIRMAHNEPNAKPQNGPITKTQNGSKTMTQDGSLRKAQDESNNIRSREVTETNTETNTERLRASAPTPAGLEVCDGDNPEERMDDAYSETDRTQYVLKMAHAHGINITIGSAMGLAKKVWTELGEEARNYIEVRTAELASADIQPRYFARFMGEDLQDWKDRAAADKVVRSVGRDDEDLSFLDGL